MNTLSSKSEATYTTILGTAYQMAAADGIGKLSLGEVAASVALSESRFRHLFVSGTGSSFRAYLLWLRINLAIDAAMAGASWTAAAHEAGFADSAHLSRTHKRMFGIEPTAPQQAQPQQHEQATRDAVEQADVARLGQEAAQAAEQADVEGVRGQRERREGGRQQQGLRDDGLTRRQELREQRREEQDGLGVGDGHPQALQEEPPGRMRLRGRCRRGPQ
eukprot:gene49845-61018_t